MLLIHVIMVCPHCGQECERFSDDKDGTEIMCTQCHNTFIVGEVKEIEEEW